MASHGRARAFFWTVLFAATGVSIAANAAHANLVVTDVPGVLAAAVATVVGIRRYQNGPNSCVHALSPILAGGE